MEWDGFFVVFGEPILRYWDDSSLVDRYQAIGGIP
jgi:hypothetical protein